MKHGLEMSRQAISQHLEVLEAVGLVRTRREGRYKFHYLDVGPLEQIAGRWSARREKTMNEDLRELFTRRSSSEKDEAYRALCTLFEMAEEPVEWAYEVWDELVDDLSHKEGSKRAFAAQMLARLAISDPDTRMSKDFRKVASVMRDEKTVTARHTLQSLWRVGLAGPKQKAMVLAALESRFRECGGEKNATLVRTDVITALGRLSRATGDDALEDLVDGLVESESDEGQRKKQRAAWRAATR